MKETERARLGLVHSEATRRPVSVLLGPSRRARATQTDSNSRAVTGNMLRMGRALAELHSALPPGHFPVLTAYLKINV